KIAIFSPNRNPYSETFIQAHKLYLKGEVYYYYGALHQMQLEGETSLVSNTKDLALRLKKKLLNKSNKWLATQRLLQSLDRNKIEVILIEYGTHAHQLLPVLTALNIPFVVHFHGYDASVHQVIENTNRYKEVFQRASKVIAVSKRMEDMLLHLGCPKDKLVYNVYGPQVAFESVSAKFTKQQLVFVGRFTDKKAPYFTIMAFQKIAHRFPEAQLLMAGQGELLNACQNLVTHFKLENQVQFLGVITPEAYRELLETSIAYVQHSITASSGDMEGTPLAILEASVAGLPVISTRHAGIPDVIVHGETGLLCEEQDVATMAQYMADVLDDIEKAKQMGANGKKHILTHYTLERHIHVLNTLLEAVAT
ncbi:MAG: glycosyltransferase, partial [Algicola sp.]|nr:glycosyltransferase [Algicola sp.]